MARLLQVHTSPDILCAVMAHFMPRIIDHLFPSLAVLKQPDVGACPVVRGCCGLIRDVGMQVLCAEAWAGHLLQAWGDRAAQGLGQ